MTREEAIKILNSTYEDFCGFGNEDEYYEKTIEARNMAIEAMQTEPCGKDINVPATDAISRQAAIDALIGWETEPLDEDIEMVLGNLPSVQPEPKTGYWILADEQNNEDVENDNYRFICSKCQCSDIHAKGTIVPYCWKCGAKMAEPQESEDAE